MGRITDLATGFPGYDTRIPKANPFLSEMLVPHGYAAWAIGKWHLTPDDECNLGAPRDRWPLGRGFERFYGFFGGETHQFAPALVHDNHFVDAPRSVADGYHLTEDLVDHAIAFVHDLRQVDPDKPFFAYFCPGACHSPHQAPPEWIERYRGRFDQGWDTWREQTLVRQKAAGLLPEQTVLSERPDWVPAWADLDRDTQRVYRATWRRSRATSRTPTTTSAVSSTRSRRPAISNARSSSSAPTTARAARAASPVRSTTGGSGTSRRAPSKKPCPCSKRSAAHAGTTTIRGAGPSPATRRSAGGTRGPRRRCRRSAHRGRAT